MITGKIWRTRTIRVSRLTRTSRDTSETFLSFPRPYFYFFLIKKKKKTIIYKRKVIFCVIPSFVVFFLCCLYSTGNTRTQWNSWLSRQTCECTHHQLTTWCWLFCVYIVHFYVNVLTPLTKLDCRCDVACS